jgi:hypothetical protein
LQFIEVVNDNDFLPIDNWDAIAPMLRAIRLERGGERTAAEGEILAAIRELNFELRSNTPGEQASVRVNLVGRRIMNPI